MPFKVPSTVVKAAEFYATHLKWRVFPLFEMSPSGVCSCPKGGDCVSPGKHPRVSIPKDSAHPATTELKQIQEWWKRWPNANIGVWLAGSNVIVLDIDKNDKKDGFKGLAEIMAYENISEFPKTLTCLTPSGGKHLYFEFCDGVPNKANSLGPGLDTWHSLHYVIVPPSNHVKGIYAWEPGDTTAPSPYPIWLKPRQRTVDTARKAGRPPKERLDPKDQHDVNRFVHALKHVDATDRDRWVMVGFAIARAFNWSDAGFEIYNTWAATAHNYNAPKTREQYFKQSRHQPPNPITTASIFEWAKVHAEYKPLEVVDDRPFEIRERSADELSVLMDMAELLDEFPIYQRGPKLVEIVPINQDTEVQGEWQPKGSYVLRELSADQLASRIYPAKVRWMRKTSFGWRPGAISKDLCGTLINVGNWPKANKLRAFVQHPTLRDDGSLLMKRGYDKASGLFLTEELDVQVPDKPTRADALKAMKALQYPFHEFKWIDGSVSLAALMSAVFTVGVRHLFDEGVPMFAVDAPRQGSGKTKIVKSISNLWFGRPMATTPYSTDHEEMKKHLASMLLNGDRVVLFDNVHSSVKVNDPTLNALLTSGRVTFRELGSQRMLEMDSAATFFMTGNGLKIVGDMVRRTIKMQIDPEGLHPMNRVFKVDPLEGYVLKHRTQLLSAALTVLVAYFQAGCPAAKGLAAIASFEAWSRIVRNMLVWLDYEDVKECVSQGYEVDDESMEIEHLLRMLFDIPELNGQGLSSAMMMPMVEANKNLKEAMVPFINGRSSHTVDHPRVINTVLSHVAKINVDNKKLLRVGPMWIVREAGA